MKKLTKAALIERIGKIAPEYTIAAEAKALKRLKVADLAKLLTSLERKSRKATKAAKPEPVSPAAVPVVVEMIPVAIFAPPMAMLASPVDASVPVNVDTRMPLLAGCFAAVYILIRSTVVAAFLRQKS